MTQVLWNLLQNACKFTPEGGAIDIRVHNEPPTLEGTKGQAGGDDLVISVSDTGIGISEENMPRIFNAFEQGERSRTRTFGGLGLGLAISRAIVELHGGMICANSEGNGKGTKILIRLQTVKAPPVLDRSQKPGVPSIAENGRRLRVLLVEDHPDTAEQLSRLLKRAGHNVTSAGSVKDAREVAAAKANGGSECPFDILISDLGLPDGSGHDLMRELDSCYGIPGIALSGFGMKEDVADSLAAGFARHMTKPVDWQELKAVILKLAEQVPA